MTAHPPHVVLRGGALETLDLVLAGLLGPVDGYCLPEDAPAGWVSEPHLSIDSEIARHAIALGTLELRDPDTTPLATVAITRSRADGARTWIAGAVSGLRTPEHGPSRALRVTLATDLSPYHVALLGGEVLPADVLRLSQRVGRPLALVVEGQHDLAITARMVHTIDDCAALLPGSRVFFIPLSDVSHSDVSRVVLEQVGVTEVEDLRHATEATAGGAVLLFTGLSGSGKSTVARALAETLNASDGPRAVLLDGDDVRAALSSELGYSAEDRDRNLQRQAWVGARVAEAGGIAICAPIAPFAATRDAMRAKVEPSSPFIVVHVSTPLEVAEARDRKGLYAKARAGLIKDFTGIDSPYEIPEDADLSIDTSSRSVDDAVAAVIGMLDERGLVVGR